MVVVGVVPVDDAEGFELFFVVVVAVGDFDSSFEELVGFLVGTGDRLGAAVLDEDVDRCFDRDFGHIGVELVEGGAEVAGEDDGFARGSSEGSDFFAESLFVGVEGFPAEELIEDFGEGSVFEGFFGVGGGTHDGGAKCHFPLLCAKSCRSGTDADHN